MNDLKSLLALRKKPQNSIWKFFGHVFLVMLTFGIWFYVWLYMGHSREKHNEEIFRQLELLAAIHEGKLSERIKSHPNYVG